MKYFRTLCCCPCIYVLASSLFIVLFSVPFSIAAPPNSLLNVYKLDLDAEDLFKDKKKLRKQNKSKNKKKRSGSSSGRSSGSSSDSSVVTAVNGNDSGIQQIRPTFQNQYLFTHTDIGSDHSELQFRATRETRNGQRDSWINHLTSLLRSHSNYLLHPLPISNREELARDRSILTHDFDGDAFSYYPHTEILTNHATEESRQISPVSREPGENAEPSADPLMDALIHIQSRLGDSSQQSHSFTDTIHHAQLYMEGLSDYPNRLLNIDHRVQVYALSGTSSPRSPASVPGDVFSLNEQPSNLRSSGRTLLGFIVLHLDESESIHESFFLELAFENGNTDEPTFRQVTDFINKYDETVVASFTNPLFQRANNAAGSPSAEAGSQTLCQNAPDYLSAVQCFVRQNRNRMKSGSFPSRSGTMSSGSSEGSSYSAEYEIPDDISTGRAESVRSRPIAIPQQRSATDQTRHPRRKENILYGSWSGSRTSSKVSPQKGLSNGSGSASATGGSQGAGSVQENFYYEIPDQRESSGGRKKDFFLGILSSLRKSDQADGKAPDSNAIWHRRNPDAPLPPTPDSGEPASNQSPTVSTAEPPIRTLPNSAESDCALYESANEVERACALCGSANTVRNADEQQDPDQRPDINIYVEVNDIASTTRRLKE